MIFSDYQKKQIKERENLKFTSNIERDTTNLIKSWMVYNEHLRSIFKKIASNNQGTNNRLNEINFDAINEEIKHVL